MKNEHYDVWYIRIQGGLHSVDMREFTSLGELSEWFTRNQEHADIYGTIIITRITKTEKP